MLTSANEPNQNGQTLRSAEVSSAIEEQEPCPSPLCWDQVLKAFRTEAQPWELQRGESLLRGRTWGEGPPVYLLPPLVGTHELYALLVWLLREDFRCVAYDDRQTRRSRPLTADDLAADLFAVAGMHGDRQLRLFAAGFGGVAALQAMLAAPERILSLVLQSGFAHRKLSMTERVLIQIGRRLRRPQGNIPFRETVQTQNHRRWFPPFDHGRWDFFLDETRRTGVSLLAERAAVLGDFDVRDRLEEIPQPVLLVRTEGDGQLAARCQDLLEARLHEVSVERLTSCGQLPFLTHPHRLAKIMRSFFSDDQPQPCGARSAVSGFMED